MPMHDWTRVGAWLYHGFHRSWVIKIADVLNQTLPRDYYALLAPSDKLDGPSAITTRFIDPHPDPRVQDIRTNPPQVAYRGTAGPLPTFFWPNRVEIHRAEGEVVVSAIEMIAPGNKTFRHAARQFARKVVRAVHAGVHVLFVDPFPPRSADPHGLHNVVWPMLNGDPHRFPPETALVAAGYEAVSPPNCYVTPFAVGQPLPDMPVFLEPDFFVTLPLEQTYAAAYADVLPMHRELLERPA